MKGYRSWPAVAGPGTTGICLLLANLMLVSATTEATRVHLPVTSTVSGDALPGPCTLPIRSWTTEDQCFVCINNRHERCVKTRSPRVQIVIVSSHPKREGSRHGGVTYIAPEACMLSSSTHPPGVGRTKHGGRRRRQPCVACACRGAVHTASISLCLRSNVHSVKSVSLFCCLYGSARRKVAVA